MPIIETLTGEVNLRKQSAKCYAFHAPKKGGNGNEEVFLDAATKNGTNGLSVRKVGTPEVFSAIPGTKQEIGGRFFRQKFDLLDGEIIKVMVTVRRGYGEREVNANVFLRVREGAAHRRLRFRLLDHADVSHTHAEIEGTFDILSLEDVEAAVKKFLPLYRIYGRSGAVAQAITEDIIIQAEQSAPTRVRKVVEATPTGETVVRFEKRKRRSVRF